MKKILVLHTGGTISMSEDDSGHIRPNSHNPLIVEDPQTENIDLTIEDIFNLPSPHITIPHMLQIKNRIRTAFTSENMDGVVITHGTDTLEETAYFLDLGLPKGRPVVVTGAMRSSNQPGTDGYYNFLTAIRVAADSSSKNRGVLVTLNGEVHAARYVTKTHTSNVATFQTPIHGPLGTLTRDRIHYFQDECRHDFFDLDQVTGNVPIIKSYAGMDGQLFDLLPLDQLDGLVIEALGAGNLPPEAFHSVKPILSKAIPVVLVSRCFSGVAEPIYAYPGGGKELHDAGILFAPELNSQKARIKLLIGLNANLPDLKKFIEAY